MQNRDVFVAARRATRRCTSCRTCAGMRGTRSRPRRSAPRASDSRSTDARFVFYAINAWDPRKALSALLRAFVRAFARDEGVALVLKTGPVGYGPPPFYGEEPTLAMAQRAVDEATDALDRDAPTICVLPYEFSGRGIDLLHEIGDAYVSLSHGEGWALGLVRRGDARHAGDRDRLRRPPRLPRRRLAGRGAVAPRSGPRVAAVEAVVLAVAALGRRPTRRGDRGMMRAIVDEPGARARGGAVDRRAHREPLRRARHGADGLHATALDVHRARRDFHFVFGLRPQPSRSISCTGWRWSRAGRTQDAATIHLHCRHLPWGPWWERIAPHLDVHRVGEVPRGFDPSRYAATDEGRMIASRGWDYAHEADFLRLEILRDARRRVRGHRHAVRRALSRCVVRARLRDRRGDGAPSAPTGIAASVAVQRGDRGAGRRRSSSSAGSTTRARRSTARWSRHSCEAAARLWADAGRGARAAAARVLPPRPDARGHRDAVRGARRPASTASPSLHLWAHLWWDDTREDFTRFHAGLFTPEWVARGTSTVAAIAQRYLPGPR